MNRLASCLIALLVSSSASSAASAQVTREVAADARAIVPVHTRLRVTTLIVLPDTEDILDIVCGDKDVWVVSGTKNLAYVKPGKAGATTNLDLVTASGHVYAFWLTEGAADADVKLYVTAGEALTAVDAAHPRFHTAAEFDALHQELEQARREAQAARDLAASTAQDAEAAKQSAISAANARIDAFRESYPGTLEFPYVFEINKKPFYVTAMFHDDKFTYIRTNGTELPALYEVNGRSPNAVSFQVDHGLYIVPKVLDRGYLVLGKETLRFGTTWWR